MPFDIFTALGAGGAALSGFGNLYQAIQGGAEGLSWGDIKKNIVYQQRVGEQQQRTQREIRSEMYREQRNLSRNRADDFGDLANRMGISRYALLGNAPGGGPTAQVTSAPLQAAGRRGSGRGASIARMGQDIQRGVGTMMEMDRLKSQKKVETAQARLLNAQADSVINQSQNRQDKDALAITEQNIHPGEDWQKYYQGIKDRGGALEDQPTLTRNNEIRFYPSQEIMDLISEDKLAKTLYYKGKPDYNKAMNLAHRNRNARNPGPLVRAYHAEKRRLSYIFQGTVYWYSDPNTNLLGHWKLKRK